MKEFDYKKIDAFTSGTSLGNPAACIYLKENQILSENEMQNIAKQHKGFVSEVVYCKPLEEDFQLTYYSSECEVEFCGHGTIACMYDVIKSTPSIIDKKEILIHTNKKGSLTVYNEIPENDAVFITAPSPEYLKTDLDANTIANNLGIPASDISEDFPIDFINAGLATLIVPIKTLETEINIFPDEQNLNNLCSENDIDIILTYSKEASNKNNIAHTRVFAPKFGYLEDPATGSGNSAFGYYMLKNNIWNGESVSIEQGGCDREFNIVQLKVNNGNVLFGGNATNRIVGKYYL